MGAATSSFPSRSGASEGGPALELPPVLVASSWKGQGQAARCGKRDGKGDGNASNGVGVAWGVWVSVPKRGQKAETAASALPSPWDTEFEALLCNSGGVGERNAAETSQLLAGSSRPRWKGQQGRKTLSLTPKRRLLFPRSTGPSCWSSPTQTDKKTPLLVFAFLWWRSKKGTAGGRRCPCRLEEIA